MIEFACWGCGKSLKAPDDAGGKKCKCTKCQRDNFIPVTEPPKPVEQPKEIEYVPPPVQTEPKIVQPIPASPALPTPTVTKPQPVQYVYVYRNHPALILFAAIGLAAIAYLGYALREGNHQNDERKQTLTYRDILYADEDTAIATIKALSNDNLERMYDRWLAILKQIDNGPDRRKWHKLWEVLTAEMKSRGFFGRDQE